MSLDFISIKLIIMFTSISLNIIRIIPRFKHFVNSLTDSFTMLGFSDNQEKYFLLSLFHSPNFFIFFSLSSSL